MYRKDKQVSHLAVAMNSTQCFSPQLNLTKIATVNPYTRNHQRTREHIDAHRCTGRIYWFMQFVAGDGLVTSNMMQSVQAGQRIGPIRDNMKALKHSVYERSPSTTMVWSPHEDILNRV